jgi:hypothetical protein
MFNRKNGFYRLEMGEKMGSRTKGGSKQLLWISVSSEVLL